MVTRPSGASKVVEWLESRKGRRTAVGGAAALALLITPAAVSTLDRALLSGHVLRGVWSGPIALSGLDREAATARLDGHAQRLQSRLVTLRVGKALLPITAADAGYGIDVPATVEAALAAGRTGGLITRTRWWWRRWTSAERIAVVARLDPKQLASLADRLDREVVERRPFAGGLAIEGERVVPVAPRDGFVVDRSRLERVLTDGLGDPEAGSVDIPLVQQAPPLSAAAVAATAAASQVLIAGSVRLIDAASDEQLELSSDTLATALTSRIELSPRPQLIAHFRTEVIAQQLRTLTERLERPPRDARFETDSRDRVRIVPGQPGVRLDPALVADALALAARSPGRIGILPLDRATEPARSSQDLEELKITGLVSQFVTYHPCCHPRVKNIHRIADLLDGTLLLPGQTFSVNETVGPRTTKGGFVPAPTIEEGEMVDSVGGGISQFATTLFNAVFHGGYDIIERTPHSYYFSRYPMGHEATLSYPKPDLVFRNDTEAGMLLRCEYSETSIRVKVFGDNGGRKIQAKVSPRQDVKQPPVEYVANSAVPPDEEEVLERGSIGWTVTVGRVLTFPDGKEKEETRKVTYNPRVRRIAVHPCRIPAGEKEHTGEPCPVPEDSAPDEEDSRPSVSEAIPSDSSLDEGF